jgi:hypothetical protein
MNTDSDNIKEEKIIIENPSALYNLPISVIKNTKLYNFSGKYFDKIYEEALKIERSKEIFDEFESDKVVIKINEIQAELPFVTQVMNFNFIYIY